MIKLKKYTDFIKEDVENDEGFTLEQLYDEGAMLIIQAAQLLGDESLEDEDPDVVIDRLRDCSDKEKAEQLINDISSINDMIAKFPEEE